MKLKLFLFFLLAGVLSASAQFTVKDGNGVVFQDGDIFEFGTTSYPDAELLFFVTNDNPNEDIFSRVQYVSQVNASEPEFEQLCYGVECYFGIQLGAVTPPSTVEAVQITPGSTTGLGNHFFSDDEGNGGVVDFVFTFKQYAGLFSTEEVGEKLTFTYRYNPYLSVEATSKVNLSLHSTVVSDRLMMDVNEPVEASIYDFQGRLIKQANLEVGQQELNVSGLSSQVYIIQFKNAAGALTTSKFIVK